MASSVNQYFQVFTSRRVATLALLGFASGLPLSLTAGTLQAYMAQSGVDIKTIGIFALVGLPYTLKFLWSPLMDRFVPPWFGRRRGWMIITQACIMLSASAMSFVAPGKEPFILAAFALALAFSSASQDIVSDAYRTDVLIERERGAGTAVFITGYRIAMLTSGAVALIMADRIGWHNTYLVMAALMAIGMIGAAVGPEPAGHVKPPVSLQEAVWGPLKDYFTRDSAIQILLLVVLYKLSDAYAGSLTTAFLLKGVGFTATEVGTINKGLGLVSTIIGAMFGGALMVRLGLYKSLLLFGVLQGVSNLSFMALAAVGHSYPMLIAAVGIENLTSGMGTAAFVSFIMSMCNQRYSATQYALLSSIAVTGRIFISPTSGYVVAAVGWPFFFLITAVSALPGLALLMYLKPVISGIGKIPKS
ncbi:MAG: MFS transporter [Nitrospirae bacterium]|nr:MFS transporter [Nitrospirota bacterium]